MTETETGIAQKATSNGEGLYTFPSLKPGTYFMVASHEGFTTTTIRGLVLTVQESLSRDIKLSIGAAGQTVTVNAEATDVENTTSELGTVIGQKQIHELPLNGRNFTQLLTLTPGATPISTSQSSGVGVNDLAVLGVPTASTAQPSIQGQTSRSNLYLLDGVVNTEMTGGVYVIPPIIDTMQRFKVQSHDDQAEFGSVLGGVVNVVTKSGTNQFHGAAWEFVRNNIFDARDSFADIYRTSPSPFARTSLADPLVDRCLSQKSTTVTIARFSCSLTKGGDTVRARRCATAFRPMRSFRAISRIPSLQIRSSILLPRRLIRPHLPATSEPSSPTTKFPAIGWTQPW